MPFKSKKKRGSKAEEEESAEVQDDIFVQVRAGPDPVLLKKKGQRDKRRYSHECSSKQHKHERGKSSVRDPDDSIQEVISLKSLSNTTVHTQAVRKSNAPSESDEEAFLPSEEEDNEMLDHSQL